jgi:guanylate kinase
MSNIFIISAPSGCGKTSLVRELCQTYSFLEQTVSYTTRDIRSGEVDGQDYHFISKDEFIKNKKNNKFIESQNVYDNFYGTTYESINEILASGKDAILEIDYKGMLLIKSKIPSSQSIYILPPSIEELEKRLLDRGLDSDEVIEKRVSKAKDELKYVKFADYTVMNDNFAQATKSLKAIILNSKIIPYNFMLAK